MKTILLSEEDIKDLISMKEIIDIVDVTFADLAKGKTFNPAKLNLNLGDNELSELPYKASMNAMPAYIGWQDIVGLKWAGGFGGGRRQLGLPFINALIILCDPNYGNFLSVMDGSWITAMRTGAQSAVALRHLIPNKKKAAFGLYGAGLQGRTQTMALASEFHIDRLVVYDPVKETVEKFKSEFENIVQGEIVVATEPKEVVNTDAFISVTSADNEFIKGEWLQNGSIFLALGSYQECDTTCVLKSDYIIVDHIEQSLHRGNLKKLAAIGKITEKDIYCTIGELAAKMRSIEDLKKKKTIIVPIGMGCLDVAVAGIVYKKAFSMGKGQEFSFDVFS